MDSKTCTKCGETKPLDLFHKNSRAKDGKRPDCKLCVNARNAAWELANRADYLAANREQISARAAAYYRNAEPGVFWERTYRQRAKKFGFEPVIESFTREELIARWGDECVHCGGPFEHLDHYVTPVFRGGAHTIENCRPSGAPCNTARNQFHKSNIAETV